MKELVGAEIYMPGRPALVSEATLLKNIERNLLNPYFRWMKVRVMLSGQLKRYFASENVTRTDGLVSDVAGDIIRAVQGEGLKAIVVESRVTKRLALPGRANACRPLIIRRMAVKNIDN